MNLITKHGVNPKVPGNVMANDLVLLYNVVYYINAGHTGWYAAYPQCCQQWTARSDSIAHTRIWCESR